MGTFGPLRYLIKVLKVSLTFFVLGMIIFSGAYAADPEPPKPGVIDRLPAEIPPAVKEPTEPALIRAPEPEQEKTEPQPFATLKSIIFEGDIILRESTLQRKVSSYLNRPLTLQDIVKLKYELTKLYYDKGYVLVKVTTPPQDLSEGILKVVIYPGNMGDLEITGTGLHHAVSKAMTGGIGKGEIFNERDIETAVKDIDDINNIKAILNLRPGKEVGTTDMVLFTEPAREDVQTFTIDNYGSRATGRRVGSIDLRKTNLLNFGESIHAYARQSEYDLTTVLVDFRMPIMVRNIFFETHYLYSEHGLHHWPDDLRYSGRTRQYGFAFSGNFVNMIQRQASWRLGIDHSRDEQHEYNRTTDRKELVSRDNITHLYLDLSYLYRKPKYVFYGSLRISKGIGIFQADEKNDPMASRLGGEPRAWRIMPTLYANFRLTEKDYLQLLAYGQLSSHTLLASDMFILGGYGSVRGYEPAQEVGENGFSFNIDYAHTFFESNRWNIKAGPFIDGGVVGNKIKDTSLDNSLYSIGIGAEAKAKLVDWAESKLRFDWAHPVGGHDSKEIRDNSFYIRFTQTFVF